MATNRAENPIENTQRWIEEEIVGRGICPPLVRISLQYRGANGKIDWTQLSREIVFEDATQFDPEGSDLLNLASGTFISFLHNSEEGRNPLSKVFICPDFPNNLEFDSFMRRVKENTLIALKTPRGQVMAISLLDKSITMEGLDPEGLLPIILNGPEEVARQLIDGAYNPTYFYGRRLSDFDVSTFPSTRGPLERQKLLSRAPYYMFQLVDEIRGAELFGQKDPTRTYSRNTSLALATNMDELDRSMQIYRGNDLN